MNIAQRRLDSGLRFPYDSYDDEKRSPPPTADWAHAAARGVMADLSDRRGIKWELEKVDEAVRIELVASIAEIIRFAANAGSNIAQSYESVRIDRTRAELERIVESLK